MFRIIIPVILTVIINADISGQEYSNKDYYSELNLENFREEPLFHEYLNFDSLDYKRIHAAIFYITNEIRAEKNLSFLAFSPELEKSSQIHSKDMYEKKFFSHTNPYSRKKKTPNDRAGLVGIVNPYLAENIAEIFGLQYTSREKVFVRGSGKFSYKMDGELIKPHTYISLAESLVMNWMNSKGHRKNILSDKALQLGCGVYFYYDREFNDMPAFKVTQNFQWYERIRSK
jgi:uncharacterized protein YkwD